MLDRRHGWGDTVFLESDVVLAVGTQPGEQPAVRRGHRFVHVDADPQQLGAVVEPDVGIVGTRRRCWPRWAGTPAAPRRGTPPGNGWAG
ncbi:hypothetical protein BJF78_20470 [Pseudonocardia sp. CNS-139]|nr:hypothetical protein BJF78_20470 [Pseudonocardia sp. CNS-139]